MWKVVQWKRGERSGNGEVWIPTKPRVKRSKKPQVRKHKRKAD